MGVGERESQGRGIGKRRGRRHFDLDRKTKIKKILELYYFS